MVKRVSFIQSIHSKQKVSGKDDPETGGTTLIKVQISALDLAVEAPAAPGHQCG